MFNNLVTLNYTGDCEKREEKEDEVGLKYEETRRKLWKYFFKRTSHGSKYKIQVTSLVHLGDSTMCHPCLIVCSQRTIH